MSKNIKILVYLIVLFVSGCYPYPAQAAFITYEFDDGWISQWTAYEILSKYGQVGVAAVPAIVLFKEDQFKTTALSREQLLTMQNAGWEVVSHSWSHPSFSSMPQTYLDASISGQHRRQGGALMLASNFGLRQQPALLMDGKTLQRCSTNQSMENRPGSFFIQPGTRNVVIHPPDGGTPYIAAILRNSVQWELESSKIYLNNLGLNVRNFAVPYHDWSSGRAKMAKLYYNSASVGWSSVNGGVTNRIPVSDPYWLARVGIASYTSVERVKKLITRAIEKDEWIILLFHRIKDSGNTYAWSPAKLEELAEWVGGQNIQVVTRQQGLDLTKTKILKPRTLKQGLCARSTGTK